MAMNHFNLLQQKAHQNPAALQGDLRSTPEITFCHGGPQRYRGLARLPAALLPAIRGRAPLSAVNWNLGYEWWFYTVFRAAFHLVGIEEQTVYRNGAATHRRSIYLR
jgi:hypothetical protein